MVKSRIVFSKCLVFTGLFVFCKPGGSGRSFDRLLLAPISLNTMVMAKISGAIFFGIVNAFVPVVLVSFVIDLSGANWLMVLAAVFLIAVTSALLGLLIATSAKEVFEDLCQ